MSLLAHDLLVEKITAHYIIPVRLLPTVSSNVIMIMTGSGKTFSA